MNQMLERRIILIKLITIERIPDEMGLESLIEVKSDDVRVPLVDNFT